MQVTSRNSITEVRPLAHVGKVVDFWTVYRRGIWVTQCAHMRRIVTEGSSKEDTIELAKLGVLQIVDHAKQRKDSIEWNTVTRQAPSDAEVCRLRIVI